MKQETSIVLLALSLKSAYSIRELKDLMSLLRQLLTIAIHLMFWENRLTIEHNKIIRRIV